MFPVNKQNYGFSLDIRADCDTDHIFKITFCIKFLVFGECLFSPFDIIDPVNGQIQQGTGIVFGPDQKPPVPEFFE